VKEALPPNARDAEDLRAPLTGRDELFTATM
jgi:hypothetical protein